MRNEIGTCLSDTIDIIKITLGTTFMLRLGLGLGSLPLSCTISLIPPPPPVPPPTPAAFSGDIPAISCAGLFRPSF